MPDPTPQGLDLEGLARIIEEGVWARHEVVDGVSCIVYSGIDETAAAILDHLAPILAGKEEEARLSMEEISALRSDLDAANERIKALEEENQRLVEDAPREVREVITLRRMRGAGLRRLMEAPHVLIESDNGYWRANGQGYTYAPRAAVYRGADAYARTRHCGPEKQVRYHVLKPSRALLNKGDQT